METTPKSPVVEEVAAAAAVVMVAPTNEVINAVAMEVEGTSNSNPPAAVEVAAVAAPPTTEVPAVAMELGGTSREAQGTPEERKRGTPDGAAQPIVKRGRGRPKGSGNKPKLALIGAVPEETAAKNWVPYIMTVEAGEDIRQRVFEFSPNASVSSCVLSAVGPVCTVHLSPSNSRMGCVRHEGYFEIIFVSASHTLRYTADGRCQAASVFSIKLANPEGNLFGGYVTGPVIAAGPVQIVMACFEQAKGKQWKATNSLERSMPREKLHRDSAALQVQPTSDKQPVGGKSTNMDSSSLGPSVAVQIAKGGTPDSGKQIPDGSDIQPGNGKEPDVGQKSSEPMSLPVVDEETVPTSNCEKVDSEVIHEEPTSLSSQHQCSEGEANDDGGQNHDKDVAKFPIAQNAPPPSEPIKDHNEADINPGVCEM